MLHDTMVARLGRATKCPCVGARACFCGRSLCPADLSLLTYFFLVVRELTLPFTLPSLASPPLHHTPCLGNSHSLAILTCRFSIPTPCVGSKHAAVPHHSHRRGAPRDGCVRGDGRLGLYPPFWPAQGSSGCVPGTSRGASYGRGGRGPEAGQD